MTILGIGTDILHVARLRSLTGRRGAQKLAFRILSLPELQLYNALDGDDGRQLRFLSVRWALKEAAYKALYPIARPKWKDLSVLKDINKPSIHLHDSSMREIVGRIHCSVSHDMDIVIAYVVVEERGEPQERSAVLTE